MAASDSALTVDDVRQLADSWVVSLRAARKSAQTVAVYQRSVEQYLRWCESADALPMRRRSLDGFIADLMENGREASTARSRLTGVKSLTAWLLAENEIELDPFSGVQRPKLDTKVLEPLTDDQIRAMLATCTLRTGIAKDAKFCNIRDEALLRIMVETGLRAGEVLGVAADDVRWRESPPYLIVRKSKTHTGRMVPFSATAALALDRYLRQRRTHVLAASSALWLGGRKNTLSYAGLYDTLVDRARRAGIDHFHPHLLRHTAAHRWLAAGGSESGLMAVAGWSRPDMLVRYTKARQQDRAIAEAQGLNLGEI
ncbi:tyrosine-type recombinase/integrase [Allobranchiibius sp. GilTou73]|uniref:tyrosine-type recombinase/integrase n=1 Tax=Allobranchiibius sp. GilTou73 TaxID=2904523 RepID=UPI001F2B9DD1|nr:tyrosine-type recombinase/integrase [Allobranchiibius sp. GilTou73]UIJ34505.1 tyrosine-type recombinase/integrase [Allobranchiibius sp. GilTou73]